MFNKTNNRHASLQKKIQYISSHHKIHKKKAINQKVTRCSCRSAPKEKHNAKDSSLLPQECMEGGSTLSQEWESLQKWGTVHSTCTTAPARITTTVMSDMTQTMLQLLCQAMDFLCQAGVRSRRRLWWRDIFLIVHLRGQIGDWGTDSLWGHHSHILHMEILTRGPGDCADTCNCSSLGSSIVALLHERAEEVLAKILRNCCFQVKLHE